MPEPLIVWVSALIHPQCGTLSQDGGASDGEITNDYVVQPM